jgi:hypothetical protein
MYKSEYMPVIEAVAKNLGMQREWLYNVIMLESAFNPAAYNKSGAVGLIQFMPSTLKDYRLLSPILAAKIPPGSMPNVPESVKQEVRKEFLAKYPDVISQLQGPVTTYFKRYRSYPTEQSVYMTVFYPAYRDAAMSQPFSAKIQIQNPGIKTVGDYVAYAQARSRNIAFVEKTKTPLTLLAISALGLIGYFSMRS